MTYRQPIHLHTAHRDDIADLRTRRPLPGPQIGQIDPFLFLNHHGPQHYAPGNNGLPFGPHPHRGFETVTFILEGELAHLDSGGHESIIRAGGVQWMTAGSGLVHAEISPDTFKRDGGPLEILQLWVNLPGRLKMVKPRYTGLQKEDIPKISAGHGLAEVELISGEFDGQQGPVQSLTGVSMMVLRLKAGARLDLSAPSAKNVFFYVVSGSVNVSGTLIPETKLAQFDQAGDQIDVHSDQGAVVLYGLAEPLDEPVVSHGPFVMNTKEEIHQAIRDYQAGLFGDSIDHIRA